MAVLKGLLPPCRHTPAGRAPSPGERHLKNEREQALAKTALALMGECNVTPSPENFELFYSYAAGENPAVGRIISEMITARRPFTPTVLQQLRDRAFPKDKTERAMGKIGDNVTASLDDIIAKLEQASSQAFDYSRALSEVSGELGDIHSPAGLKRLVTNLVSATKAMENRARALEGELQSSSQQVSELKTQLDHVRKESLTDPLTGVANRKAFDTELQAAIDLAEANDEPLALFMCDIDHFKSFNDTWGHQTGDQVLRLVATCLSENTKGRDTAARYGGEEFAVIVRRAAIADAIRVADQIRTGVENKKLVKKSTGDILGSITISIGVAQFIKGESAAALVQRADACLYSAKHSGRNCVIGDNDPRYRDEQEIDAA